MSRLIITGGKKLKGEITVDGAKNAVLPIIAATVLNGDTSIIKNCPDLHDVSLMLEIMKGLGCRIHKSGKTIKIDSSSINNTIVSENPTKEMRSSIFLMGPILAKFKKVTICYPGGCVFLLALSRKFASLMTFLVRILGIGTHLNRKN